jgi:hypothetical protein
VLIVDVFVSRPTWVATEFEGGLAAFLRVLHSLDLTPRTLGATDYPSKAPLDEVIALMDKCAGAVILGYPQLVVETGQLKGMPVDHTLELATEWNHIEAGLAYARGLPLLVIHHRGVRRGIFDRGAMSAFLYEADLTKPGWPVEEGIHGAVQKWKRDCLTAPPRTATSGLVSEQSDKATCPNCSTAGRPFFLRPIPAPFSTVAGGTWECSKCGYVR